MKLKRIIEQQEMSSQYYDLGKDFSSFTHTIDAASEEVKNRFEQSIASKIKGKKIRARASRGYKQFEKDYEIDVANVSLDDYYDNYVVVVKTPNNKEYFLKPGFKVQILGAMEPENPEAPKAPATPPAAPPPAPAPAATQTPSQEPPPVQEAEGDTEMVKKYPVEKIVQDISAWLPQILVNKQADLKSYVPRDGVSRTKDRRTAISYGVTIPVDDVPALDVEQIKQALSAASKPRSGVSEIDNLYTLEKFDTRGGKYVIIIKKITNY